MLVSGVALCTGERDLYMSQRSVQKYLELFHTTGDLEVVLQTTPVHRLRKLSEFEQVTILEHLLNTPGVYLREVQENCIV